MNMKKFLAMALVCMVILCSFTACAKKEYETELAALKLELAELQEQVERLENPSKELLDAVNDLANKINALKPSGSNFEASASEYYETLNTLSISVENEQLLKYITFTNEITNYVAIQVDGYGTMVLELYPDTAPITVENFQTLVSEKFYDGLIFHRVIADFMIQGGDPEGTGYGGSDKEIVGEFSSNGIDNDLKHTRGVISMARSNDPDSASSQFFICHADASHLDGSYAAFGEVVYGITVVDRIAAVETNANDKPLTDVVISSIRFVTLNEAE